MKKRIFYFKGSADTGKTIKINTIAKWIIKRYNLPNTIDLVDNNLIIDTFGVLTINNFKIGINSAGDNKREVSKIDKFAEEVDIIICSCRTRGESYHHIKDNYNYNNGWLSFKIGVKKIHYSDTTGQLERDNRLIDSLKTWLVGLEK